MEAVLPMRRRSCGSIRSPNVKRDIQSLVVMKGWLHKLEGAALKQWKQRWCVLADFCLFFYKSPSEDKVFSTVLLPSYKINPCDSEDRISRKFAFKAEHHNMKTYYFAAENKESMKRWMNAMSLASIMQNMERREKVESGISSISNDEEDSGFGAYRSRRYCEQDPNSTFDSSQGSEIFKQRSQSCSDRASETYLSSDDKYPVVPKASQRQSNSAVGNRPRQPLYANAPPKPRRLPQSDPFTISPGEQYDEIAYNYQPDPDMYRYSDIVYPNQVSNMQFSPPYEQEFHYRDEKMPCSDSYPHELNSAAPEPNSYVNDIQRPRSADFLERESESLVPMRHQEQKEHRPRPKSSMEYGGRYWNADEYNEDDYRNAVRLQADNLYTSMAQERHKASKPKSPSNTQHHVILEPSQQQQPPVFPSKPHPRHRPENAVNRLSDHACDFSYLGITNASSPPKKQQSHEESMRRLMEWKQRMLQSPLSRRAAQYSSSSSDTGSPRRWMNGPATPKDYRTQVIRELESREARFGHSNGTPSSPKRKNVESSAQGSHNPSDKNLFEDTNHQDTMNDLNHAPNNFCSTNGDHLEMNACGSQDNVMYCLDSENNELLIYGDEFITEVPASRSLSDLNRPLPMAKSSAKSCRAVNRSPPFFPHAHKLPIQGAVLRRTTTQNLNVSDSSDDEASVEKNEHKYKRRNKSMNRSKNASDSEIHIHEPSHLQNLVEMSEGIMNKGKRLSVSAGDLLGKTHEELVLLLIQLRRNQSRIMRAKEKCLQQLENLRHISQIDEGMRQTYVMSYRDLIQQVTLLEKQYEFARPLVNLVGDMVKLGSMYGTDKNDASNACNSDSSDAREMMLQSDLTNWFSSDEIEVQDQLAEIYGLDKELSQDSHSYSSLQQDKEILESTLHGMKYKIMDHQDKPVELQKLRKQQQMIEKELTRVKRLLSQSAKKIEDATTKNDQLEHEILLLRQKLQQALTAGPCESKSSQSRADLEAELTRVQNVLEELANHRQEINNAVETLKKDASSRSFSSTKVRASPTGVAGSAPLPLRKKQQSTYLETDLDTMETCDLSNICRDFDDFPVYANAEEINHEVVTSDSSTCQENSMFVGSGSTGSDKENISQCSLQDINDADDKMKRFYGILPREKPCEIKTVRIVKRQSERRNRERDKKRVTYDENSLWIEPDLSSDDLLDTDEETFSKSPMYARPPSFLVSPSANKSSNSPTARERLFGSGAAVACSSDGPKAAKRSKRRHYTVSGCQYLNDPLFQLPRDKPRSRDDVDMERCLRTVNTPDIVRSTIKKNDVFDDEIIDRELGLPEKISIPERYVEDEPETLTASERLKRSQKAENIRRMLSETTATYENVKKSPNAPSESLHEKFTEQKRNRAHLLALNRTLAQEAMERSKVVAVFAKLKHIANCEASEEDSTELPISQQRYNFLS